MQMTPIEPLITMTQRQLEREKSISWVLGVLAGFAAAAGVAILFLRSAGVPI